MAERPYSSAPASLPLASHSLSNHLPPDPQPLRISPATRFILDLIPRLPLRARQVAEACLYTGARINEILSLRCSQVDRQGRIFIRAGKGSASRVVYYPAILPLTRQAHLAGWADLFPRFSYFQFRRQCLSVQPTGWPTSGLRKSIGNAFRRAAADLAISLSQGELSVAQEFLGHKASTSTKYYLPNQKEPSNG